MTRNEMRKCVHCARRYADADITGRLYTYVECMAFDEKRLDACVCNEDCCEYEPEEGGKDD